MNDAFWRVDFWVWMMGGGLRPTWMEVRASSAEDALAYVRSTRPLAYLKGASVRPACVDETPFR